MSHEGMTASQQSGPAAQFLRRVHNNRLLCGSARRRASGADATGSAPDGAPRVAAAVVVARA